MLIDLNDPENILRWWKVWPARHDGYLEFELRARPQFAPAIREVQRRIATDPELSAMLATGVRESREREASWMHDDVAIPAFELKDRAFAAMA